jgi:hypothetical protein
MQRKALTCGCNALSWFTHYGHYLVCNGKADSYVCPIKPGGAMNYYLSINHGCIGAAFTGKINEIRNYIQV